jgi:hypothetical protein
MTAFRCCGESPKGLRAIEQSARDRLHGGSRCMSRLKWPQGDGGQMQCGSIAAGLRPHRGFTCQHTGTSPATSFPRRLNTLQPAPAVAWQPAGSKSTAGVIVPLSGYDGWVRDGIYPSTSRSPAPEKYGCAILSLQWWVGQGESTKSTAATTPRSTCTP